MKFLNKIVFILDKVEDSKILSVIKSEFKLKNRIASDLHNDAAGAKIVFDNLLTENKKIKGFIHELGIDPFGFVMTSEIQVNKIKNLVNYI